MQIIHCTNALNSFNFRVIFQFAHFHDTGADGLAVYDHSTGAALSLTAAYFTSRQHHLFTEYLGKGILFPHDQSARLAVDLQYFFNHIDTSLGCYQFLQAVLVAGELPFMPSVLYAAR